MTTAKDSSTSSSASAVQASTALPCAKLAKDLENLWAMTFSLISKMDAEGASHMPAGSRNHLHWHIGHLIYSQVFCLHVRSGEPSPFRSGYEDYFGLGSSPANYDSLVPDWDEVLAMAKKHSSGVYARIESKLHKPLTKPLKFMNITMTTPAEVLPFLIAHIGEHIGHVKRLVKAWETEKAR